MAASFRFMDEKEEVMIVENNQILRVWGGEEEPRETQEFSSHGNQSPDGPRQHRP